MTRARVTLFAGHYGSGKTNIAVNYALALRAAGEKVKIADLDIVNPYFRTRDSAEELEAAGVELISSAYANTNVDFPAMNSAVYGLVQRRDAQTVFDVGGDDRGALALGRFVPYILEENDYEMLFVVNFRRPLTPDAESALEIMREIESACKIPFTAVVNNTNLGCETTAETLLDSLPLAQELCRLASLPLKMTCAEQSVAEKLRGKAENIFPLKLQRGAAEL
ncbi:MAG: hypothetical protein LUE06_09290 [Oscillospiraceae bacterium]|nr:hypothetical protein [Oscillospiraceae bacterium]